MGLFQDALTTELISNSSSYIFDGAGGMRNQLEQLIVQELKNKNCPFRVAIENVKSGNSKEQCVTIEVAQGHRIVVANTTVGSYLYVCIYHLIRVLNSQTQMNLANTVTDIFYHQQINAAYAATVAACESAFAQLNLKQTNHGYRPVLSGAKNES